MKEEPKLSGSLYDALLLLVELEVVHHQVKKDLSYVNVRYPDLFINLVRICSFLNICMYQFRTVWYLYVTVPNVFKGTVSRGFLLLLFFLNQFPPSF